MMPVVSIITPAYNCISTIREVYQSVINQSFGEWEWIIVDDCSIDESFNFLKKLTLNDKRIILLRTEKNSGSGTARNLGLKIAKGKYVTFLDSDDTIDSNYLEQQLIFIKENGPIVSAGYRRKAEKTCTDFFVPEFVDYNVAIRGNPLSCLTTMYDKEIIGDVFFPEKIDKPEDYIFWLSILKKGFVAKGNHQILGTYFIRKGSKSSNKMKLVFRMHKVYHKTQDIGWFKSWFYVFRWAIYGRKKYKNVK